MKHIGRFLVYCWSSWELWQKMIIFSLILNIASVFAPKPWGNYLGLAGLAIVAGMVLTWWFTGMLIPKWRAYKAQQNELLTTIRDADK